MRAKLVLAAISLLLALAAGEMGLRVLGYYGVRGADIEKLRLVDDPTVDYRRIPNTSWISNNLRYDINSQGWRDREHPIEKPAGTYRILSVGDSVTNGHGVSVEEIYTKQLEAMLNSPAGTQAPGVDRYEVVLMTQGALNTEQEVHLIEVEGISYSPDLIVVGYVLNDPAEGASLRRDRERARSRGELASLKEAAKRSSLVHLGYRTAQRAAWAIRRSRGRAEVAAYATDDYFAALHRNPASWARVTTALDRLRRISETEGIPVLVTIFPVLHDLDRYRWLDVHDLVARAATERGFHVLDLLPAYLGRDPNELQVVEGDHVHPNATGHRLAAEAIHRFLVERLWTPDDQDPPEDRRETSLEAPAPASR